LTPLALPDLALAAAVGVLTWAGVQVEKKIAAGTTGSDFLSAGKKEV